MLNGEKISMQRVQRIFYWGWSV